MVISRSEARARGGARQVWLLAWLGLTGGAISLAALGTMQARVQSARKESDRTRGELAAVIAQSENHLAVGRSRLTTDLFADAAAAPSSDDWVDALRDVIARSRTAIPVALIDSPTPGGIAVQVGPGGRFVSGRGGGIYSGRLVAR